MLASDQSHIIKLKDGRQLAYSQFGNLKGKPIFYFHGWPNSRLRIGFANSLANKLGIRIIGIDRPGFGLSDYQADRKLLDWPDDVVELADDLKIKQFSILGVSGGGPYAAVCGYKIPDRINKIAIVVGLAPTYIPKILDDMPWYNRLGWANYRNHKSTRFISTFIHYITIRYCPLLSRYQYIFWSAPDRKILFDKKTRSNKNVAYAEAFRQGYKGPMLDLKLYTQDWAFNVADIKSKVFLFYGADDKNVPLAMGKYYASAIKNSKLKIYPNEGHLISKTHIEEILKSLY